MFKSLFFISATWRKKSMYFARKTQLVRIYTPKSLGKD